MNIMYAFMWLLVVHFIADFVFQSDWIAKNKSKSNEALTIHVAVYISVLALGSMVLVFYKPIDPAFWLAFILFNGAAHFATDYITSRINSKLWEQKRVHGFFVGVGADQLIHALTLGFSLIWLLK